MNETITPVTDVETGDLLSEADGFLWKVTTITNPTPRTVELTMEPMERSITARGPVTKRFRATSQVRVYDLGLTNDERVEMREAIRTMMADYDRHQATYPRTNEQGRTVWACCESSIGPACGHRS